MNEELAALVVPSNPAKKITPSAVPLVSGNGAAAVPRARLSTAGG